MQAGLAIAPGPLTALVFAFNSGRIVAHLGRSTPAMVGSLCAAASALFWLVATRAHRAYLRGFLPGLVVAGVGAGLTEDPLFAASGSLPADRAATGSAVLNMSRQVGSGRPQVSPKSGPAAVLCCCTAEKADSRESVFAHDDAGWRRLIKAQLGPPLSRT
jgi:hypothetical protein